MIRGTTPTLEFGIPFDADEISTLFVTFSQGAVVLDKDIDDVTVTDKKITVELTQADTLKFRGEELLEIQVRIKTTDGSAFASDIIKTSARRILKDGQI